MHLDRHNLIIRYIGMSVAPVSREYDRSDPMALLLIAAGFAFLNLVEQTAQFVDRYVFVFNE